MNLTALELCAGGGGQALGLEMAGFHHLGVVEYEPLFCTTLRKNRPHWNVLQMDIRHLRAESFKGVDLLAAGVPCPPFSIAGKQLGGNDERDMFPATLDIIRVARPRAVMLENVKGLDSAKFEDYRRVLFAQLSAMGYAVTSRVLEASDYGVPQLRPRFIIVALREADFPYYSWPRTHPHRCSVGETLIDLMGENGWPGAEAWAARATDIAPTLVGGSKKHGGPDLGPTRAKQQWRKLGVDGLGIANSAPSIDFPMDGLPRLTIRMAARIQSIPDEWQFMGGKTASYRQIGNAFPPLVARAVATSILSALNRKQIAPPEVKTGQLVLMEAKAKRGYKCRKTKAPNS
jgi:DNA (cytosine-5)-methyltransferase 1